MRRSVYAILLGFLTAGSTVAQEAKEPETPDQVAEEEGLLDDLLMTPDAIVVDMIRCQEAAEVSLREGCMARLYLDSGVADLVGGVGVPDAEPSVGVGRWLVQSGRSLVDDSETVWLRLGANESFDGGFGAPRYVPLLTLSCIEGREGVSLRWGENIFDPGFNLTTPVTWRVGEQEARTENWAVSNDFIDVMVPSDSHARDLMISMVGEDRFLARVTPMMVVEQTATFDISGLAEAIVPLREACGW